MNSVGTYEAKAHLSKLLERVEKGEQFIITRHGVPIARLVPPENARKMTAGSVAMAWCFEDESNAYTDAALEKISVEGAFVPSIWPLEMQNVLLVAERRTRIEQAQSARFLEIIGALPIHIDLELSEWPSGRLMSIARELNLSAYDSAYVELAMRQGAQLATLDKRLRKAAHKMGVAIFK